MSKSLQQRLSTWLISAMAVTGLLGTVASFLVAYDDAREFQDHMLKQIALMADRNTAISTPVEAPRKRSEKHALSDAATRISVVRLPEDQRPAWLAGNLKPGFHTLKTDAGRIRLYLVGDTSGKATVVAQPTSTRDEIAMNSALFALIPLLLLLPVMVWLIVHIIGRQLAPVSRLAAHLDEQAADHPRPLSDKDLPAEIIPFVQAINRLFARINALTNQQRRFIADAAHELRSPLTALSIQAQNLTQSGTLETMQERVLPLQAGIERTRKLTEQLLRLARTQAEKLEATMVDVSAMAREMIAEYLPMSEMKQIDLGLDEEAPLKLFSAPETLRMLLRNALENALRYVQVGGEVTLRLYSNDASNVIEVVDNGPGIPSAERERVFDPFYRMPGTAGEGSGLGLSIAREAAISLGGVVSLHDRAEGSGVVFRFQLSRQ
jgi:two-component system OmpR family sensor kinase